MKKPKPPQIRAQHKADPFRLRALAQAALVVCFQSRKPPQIPTAATISLWATAQGLPMTSARWSRLERDKLIRWEDTGWKLTTAGARVLRAGGVKFPSQIVKGART